MDKEYDGVGVEPHINTLLRTSLFSMIAVIILICFAVKTILSDGWYRLTPEFVENNVREEIKPLPLIEKNKQLKAENAEYKRVFEIIVNKKVDFYRLSVF